MKKSTMLKVRGGSATYKKDDGSIGTAGKGALMSEEVTFTLSVSQDQTLFTQDDEEYIVRRLTPKECERLQGFPDDWTKIDQDTSDTRRYKQMGNSMAVPVMMMLGRRIEAFDILHGDEVDMPPHAVISD